MKILYRKWEHLRLLLHRLQELKRQSTYLTHADGTPFFWLACTAWNGALRLTDTEWDQYLRQRVENNYTAVQFVTTQWRGCEKSSEGLVAFEGCGRIRVNPDFFKLIDRKIDRVNEFGLVAVWWFNPVKKEYSDGYGSDDGKILSISSPSDHDMLLILEEQVVLKDVKIRNKRIISSGK